MFLSQFSFSQINVENDSIIIWNTNRKITWEDFLSEKRIYEKNINAGAVLTPSIQIYPKEVYCWDINHTKVVAQMNKTKSWADIKTKAGLNHEQTHFNIAELYARKIRKAIEEFIKKNGECDLQNVAEIYYRLEEEHWQTQFLYDDETKHSLNFEKQQEWDEKINKLLEKYKDYELVIDIEDLELER